MTKFALLAAASAAAIVAAGAAQAGTLTATVGTTPVTATAAAPFTIASERTNAVDATVSGGFTAINTLPSNITVSAGTTQNYRVTFTVAGGTIASPSLTANSAGATPTADTTYAAAGSTATSATYIVTVVAPAGVGGDRVINNFRLNATLSNSAAEAAVTVASQVELLAGGVSTVVDTTAATTLISYAQALGAFSVTSNNALAALPNFQSFTAGATPAAPITVGPPSAAELASNYSVVATPTTALTFAGNTFYAGLGGAAPVAVIAADILNGGTLVVTGGTQLNSLVPSLTNLAGGAAPVTRTASTATFVLDNTAGDNLLNATVASRPDFVLTQNATPVTISPTSFTATFAPIYAANYTAPAASGSVASGNINLDGVNFIAPWVGGSQAATKSVIRLSNGGSAASGIVTLRLNNGLARAAGVTTGPGAAIPAATCSTIGGAAITIPTTGDLQIGQTELAACFGAFLRGDVQITIQSASTNLTAKMRQVESDGTTYESSLGRFSGADAASAAF